MKAWTEQRLWGWRRSCKSSAITRWRAVVAAADDARVQAITASDAKAVAGRGVEARVGERHLAIASDRWFDELRLVAPERLAARAAELEQLGNTVSWLVDLGGTRGAGDLSRAVTLRVLALLAFGDSLKPGARAAIARLSAMSIKSMLLTGDNAGSAASVAKSLGITPDAVHAQMLPADKARVIAELKASAQGAVAMAGDGINDVPALAATDIGLHGD